ncbi:twin-arginine translocase TatA/TatE family subunit [Flavobacteriales bacterium]|nr:twin-arginine translocase TatA/TatE family subunit [Flavobacteriales bacterium]
MQILLLNLGFGEILLIGFIYLIFFGSNNLPAIMRDFGRLIFKIKNSVNDIYQEFSSEDEV